MSYGTRPDEPPLTGAIEGRTGGLKAVSHTTATGFIIELPLPPSVNRTMPYLGNKSPGIQRWRLVSDSYLYEQKIRPQQHAIKGRVLVDITWAKAEEEKSDIDNRIKPLLDYLQSRKLIENDKKCVAMRVGFGETKYGCRVEVLPRREA